MKKSTVVSVVLFAALLAGAVAIMQSKPERGIARISFAEVQKDSIDRISIKGKNPVELIKQDGAWRIENGKAADTGAVTRLLDSITKLKSSDLLTRDSSRNAEYEVDAEKGVTVIATAGGKKVAEFTAGKSVSGGLAVSVKEGVFKVASLSPAIFSKPAASWVERKLFADKLDEVSRLEVKLAAGSPYALVKKDNAWGVEDQKVLPQGFRFDPDAARSLVSSIVNLRAKDFEEKNPGVEKTGLGEKADVLTFVVTPREEKDAGATADKAGDKAAAASPADKPADKADKPADTKDKADAKAAAPAEAKPAVVRVVRLGATKEGDSKDVYAQIDGRDEVFTLPESTAKSLRKAVLELRDLKLITLDKSKVQKLSVSDGKNTTSFEKKAETWQLAKTTETKPADFELDSGAVERRLTTLASARGVKVVDPKEAKDTGLGGAGAKVVATLDSGATVTLAFGKETKDDNRDVVFAKGNADNAIYLVNKWTLTNLTGGLATFKKQAAPAGDNGFGNLDPKALSSLPPEVRESLMRQMRDKQNEQAIIKSLQEKAQKQEPKK